MLCGRRSECRGGSDQTSCLRTGFLCDELRLWNLLGPRNATRLPQLVVRVMWPPQGCNFQEILPFRKDLDSCIMTNQAGLGDLNWETGTGQRWSWLTLCSWGLGRGGDAVMLNQHPDHVLAATLPGLWKQPPSAQMQAPHSAAGDELWG